MRIPHQAPTADPPAPDSRPRTPLNPPPPDSPSLDESWCPVGTPTHSESGHTDDLDDDDHDSLVTLGSSAVFSSNGSNGTRSSADEHELEAIERSSSPVTSDLLGGESYIDAEAPSTILSSPSARSAASAHHMPLIYPYPDLGDSFDSSTTVSDTTPSASVGALQSVSDIGPVKRSSRYRLEGSKPIVHEIKHGEMDSAVHPLFSPFTESAQPRDSLDYNGLTGEPKSATTPGPAVLEDARSGETKHDNGRIAINSPRLRLAITTAKSIRQRWSLRMSLIALTSLVSVAVATVRYSTAGHPFVAPPAASTPAATLDVRSYSILDYLSVPSLSSSMLSESGSSSFMPDVRLIKNALSLSTKSAALAPAEVKSTHKAPKPQVQVPTSKSAGPTSHSLSLSLRNSDVGLTTLIDASTKWHRSLRGLTKCSELDPAAGASTINQTNQTEFGYGQMILSDLQSAWSRAVSDFSYTDFIHFIRNQILATIKAEINEAIVLANQVIALSRNVTRATASHIYNHSASVRALTQGQFGQYVRDEIHHIFVDKLGVDSHIMSTFNTSRIDRTAARHRVHETAQKAKAGLDAISSQAAMTTKLGKDAIYKARAGLDHLIAETQRLRGGDEARAMPLPLERKCRTAHCRRQSKRDSGLWSRKRSCNGRMTTSSEPTRRRVAHKSSWRQRLYHAMNNAAPAFIR